jgi:hypothetical protein
MHLSYLDDLRDTFGEKVLPAIRTDSAVGRAQSLHQTVFEYDDASKAAEDFRPWRRPLSGKGWGRCMSKATEFESPKAGRSAGR